MEEKYDLDFGIFNTTLPIRLLSCCGVIVICYMAYPVALCFKILVKKCADSLLVAYLALGSGHLANPPGCLVRDCVQTRGNIFLVSILAMPFALTVLL